MDDHGLSRGNNSYNVSGDGACDRVFCAPALGPRPRLIVRVTTMSSLTGTVPYGSLAWAHTWHYGNLTHEERREELIEYYDHLIGKWGEK